MKQLGEFKTAARWVKPRLTLGRLLAISNAVWFRTRFYKYAHY